MTLQELVDSGKISYQEAQVYTLFHLSEGGRKWYEDLYWQTFMSEPVFDIPETFRAEIFAYNDGRRSIIRQIALTIDMVKRTINEV